MIDQFAVNLEPNPLLQAAETISTKDVTRIPSLLLRAGIVQTSHDDARAPRAMPQ